MTAHRRATAVVLLAAATTLSACNPSTTRTVPSTAFGTDRPIELLVGSGALHLAFPEGETWEIPEDPLVNTRRQRPRPPDCPPTLYESGPYRPRRSPATVLAGDRRGSESLPTVSIAAETCRLRRLVGFPFGRGRQWEEPAFVSILEGEQIRWSAAVGLRIHGNYSRRIAVKNYRLVARPIYSPNAFPAAVVGSTSDEALERLVLRRDTHQDIDGRNWYFVNALSLDIAERIGAVVPPARAVRFVLNGQDFGPFTLVERIDERFLERRLGPGPWEIASDRRDPTSDPYLIDLVRRGRDDEPRPFDYEEISRRIDLDSLIRWHLAIVLCATTDADQATLARTAGGRWTWITWDMDEGLRRTYRALIPAWRFDPFRLIHQQGIHRGSLTARLLWLLLDSSDEFRRRYVDTATEILDHRLTPEYLAERLAHYRRLNAELGLEEGYLDDLEEFLDKRPEAVRGQLDRLLDFADDPTDG